MWVFLVCGIKINWSNRYFEGKFKSNLRNLVWDSSVDVHSSVIWYKQCFKRLLLLQWEKVRSRKTETGSGIFELQPSKFFLLTFHQGQFEKDKNFWSLVAPTYSYLIASPHLLCHSEKAHFLPPMISSKPMTFLELAPFHMILNSLYM